MFIIWWDNMNPNLELLHLGVFVLSILFIYFTVSTYPIYYVLFGYSVTVHVLSLNTGHYQVVQELHYGTLLSFN
jgi:hypothetical protein